MTSKLLILSILICTTIVFSENYIPIEETEQRKDQWCWSGCSTPILNYYGEDVSQGEIVEYAYGDSSINQWNWLTGSSAVDYQGTTYYPHGINQIMDNWNTPNEAGYWTITESEWKQEVDDGHPFVVRWGWTSGGGHFVVGTGYLDNGNYQIMNPWFGKGYTVNTFDWIQTAEGGKGNWTHTLTTDREVQNIEMLISPNGNEIFTKGDTYDITWNATSLPGSVTIELYRHAETYELYSTLASGITSTGSFSWTVADSIPIEGNYYISIQSTDGSDDLSDASFTFVDPTVETYTVSVTNGSGDGRYEENDSVTIIANEAPEGFVFDSWSGDITKVTATFDSVSTFEIGTESLQFTANYKEQAIEYDTSDLSQNLLEIGFWEGIADDYGSFAIVDTSFIERNSEVICTVLTTNDDESADIWAWSQVYVSVDTTLDEVNCIKITYSSSDEVRLVLDQEELSLDGEAYGFTLPAGTDTTVCINIDQFTQPDYVEGSDARVLDMSVIKGLAFEAISRDTEVYLTVSELKLNKYRGLPTDLMSIMQGQIQSIALIHNQISLQGFTGESARITLYSVNGREIYSQAVNLQGGSSMIALPSISTAVILVKVESSNFIHTQKFMIQ